MRDYSLVTPDGGKPFEFDSKYWTVDFGIPDGFGLPPIEHVTQKQFKQPGELLQDIHIGARLVTITGGINGDCLEELHSLRKRLFSALRWNRTNDDPPLPSQLRYRLNNKAAYLNCYYAGDVIANVGTDEKQQTIGIKLIAYDPLWYGEAQEDALSVKSELSVSNIIGKIAGAWSAMGNVGTGPIYAIAVSPDGNTVYIGGDFDNWAGIANADNIAQYNLATGTWSAIGTGTDDVVLTIAIAPDGTLYAGGGFNNAGGVACLYIAKWNGIAWSPLGTGMDASNVEAIVVAPDGTVYAGGGFTQAGGVANTARIAKWNGVAWSPLGTGMNSIVFALLLAPDGSLYAGGAFTTASGNPAAYIAKWNGSAWSALSSGMDANVDALALGKNGILYAGGNFTTAGGISASKIAKWNGNAWSPLGAGVSGGIVRVIRIDDSGLLYAVGTFTSAGGIAVADRVAQWNGSTWAHLDTDLPGAAIVTGLDTFGDDVYFGFDTTGNAIVPAITNVTDDSDVKAYPVITFTGPGTLQWIENVNSAKKIILNVTLVAGEVVTIDLSPRVKTLTSSSRGDLLPYAALLPLSDFGSFALEPDPIAPLGVNTLNVLMTGTTPIEQNDNNNQLSNWANITGVTYLNTDSSGRMYASIIADGGGFYHVALYKDSARTELVGHTASYNGAGTKAIVADNASGLGGTVTVDAVTAADADIIVYFATGKIEWTDAYLSVDANVGV